jgi:iron complex transport system ATP-binding protein
MNFQFSIILRDLNMSFFETQNLTVQSGSFVCKKKFNHNFERGQMWGIWGENGTGKTTFLHTLAGLKKPAQGSILLNEQPLELSAIRVRAQQIGLLLQTFEFVFPCSVLDMILTGRYAHQHHWLYDTEQDKSIAKEALTLMDLQDFQHRDIQQLSGGEQQRVMLATLLTQNPEIYLLDEPVNHLDRKHSLQVLSLFKKLTQEKNKLVILVLHEMQWINEFCDHVIMFDED